MANDRKILSTIRKAIDHLLGDGFTHTIAFRLPEILRVQRSHFTSISDPRKQRNLFANAVRYVQVETHSYCNRKCWFCPNSIVDRQSRRYLPEPVFLQILNDLRSIRYQGEFGFSSYNEPFADDVIFDRIRQTHEALPRARLQIFSNGDFLTPTKLRVLNDFAVRDLFLGVYLPDHVNWSTDAAERFIGRLGTRLQLTLHGRQEAPGTRLTYHAQLGALNIRAFCPNYAKDGVDRGGVISGVPTPISARTSPCLYPFTNVYIEYDGSMMPCSHLRSDLPAHAGCGMGKIDEQPGSIFSVWTSGMAAQWRRSLIAFVPKRGPCRTCTAQTCATSLAGRAVFRAALHCGARQ